VYYPGQNPYQDAIKEFYIIFDSIIGRFIETMGSESSLIILSDHGHRRRCSKCLNLNEIFRQKKYLEMAGNGAAGVLKKLLERAKVFTISSLSRCGLQDWIYKIAKFIPNRKALKKSTYLINKNNSPVSLSNLCGTNPFGGLDILADSKEEHEKLCDDVIAELLGLNETLGVNIIKWAKRREFVYKGKYEKRLPDILFELDDEYGVGMDLYLPYVTENFTHRKISGGHKKEGVFLVRPGNDIVMNISRPRTVIDISEYIFKLISVE
jgi:predicted AlkP superfamily phosphohydrolase/phosphomutase